MTECGAIEGERQGNIYNFIDRKSEQTLKQNSELLKETADKRARNGSHGVLRKKEGPAPWNGAGPLDA
jgi:hypothetical protein